MNSAKRNILLLSLMVLCAIAGYWLRPSIKLAEKLPPMDLQNLVPKTMGEWEMEPEGLAVVNPQGQTLVKQLYSQVLTRNYLNTQSGERVMISIAYGENQSDSFAVHLPDICYPAQGFRLLSLSQGILNTSLGDLRVKRLVTEHGNRQEPLTYWTMVGEKPALGGLETKLAQMSYGLHGYIPDGLVFRVSSLGRETEAAFSTQQKFVQAFVLSIPRDKLSRLTGLH